MPVCDDFMQQSKPSKKKQRMKTGKKHFGKAIDQTGLKVMLG